ncbi:MBL fold metallo-hydrolase [bacterium]|nr:MBL fold metallo-hydrolase [bacterium]
MIIHKIEVGELFTNCYIVICKKTKKSFIVDPGEVTKEIEKILKETFPIYIINTHGHIDHIKGNKELKERYNLKVLIHKDDASSLEDGNLNLSRYVWGKDIILPKADQLLKDNDTIRVGDLDILILYTPGHSPGGISLLVKNQTGDKVLFTGDTLFASSVGRVDLYGGSLNTLIRSIKEKILVFEDHLFIYPGHGPLTEVGIEKASNPYL